MARFVYWLILIPLFFVVILFAVNNSGSVEISLWPALDEKIVLPAHTLALAGLFFGFVFGGLVAWMQGGSTRSRLRQVTRLHRAAQRELEAMKSRLATLEGPKTPALPARSGGH